jgi:glutaredoxin-related protein
LEYSSDSCKGCIDIIQESLANYRVIILPVQILENLGNHKINIKLRDEVSSMENDYTFDLTILK